MKLEVGKTYINERCNKVRIICTDYKTKQGRWGIGVEEDGEWERINTFTLDGKFFDKDGIYADLNLIREWSEWEGFQIDEPVMVRNSDDCSWKPAHFAGTTKNGRPLTFANGMTSWSNDIVERSTWHQCRRPTPEELSK